MMASFPATLPIQIPVLSLPGLCVVQMSSMQERLSENSGHVGSIFDKQDWEILPAIS